MTKRKKNSIHFAFVFSHIIITSSAQKLHLVPLFTTTKPRIWHIRECE